MSHSNSKETILQRVRQALGEEAQIDSTAEPVGRSYHRQSRMTDRQRIELFAERVGEYKATVKILQEEEVPAAIGESLRSQNAQRIVVPPGFNKKWRPAGLAHFTLVKDEPKPLSNSQLDECDAVLTGCYLAAAQTGTIVLNGGAGQGRRALTLIPDFHICVVQAGQIRGIIPEVFAELDEVVKVSGPPITFISGPSATSDIELNRVEGVHGPRRLHVFIIID